MTDGKTLDEKTLKRTWDRTSQCYHDACDELGYSNADIKEDYYDGKISKREFIHLINTLDERYRELLCNLSTEDLENMVLAWENNHQRRGPKTMETVTTELLERQLNKEEDEVQDNS